VNFPHHMIKVFVVDGIGGNIKWAVWTTCKADSMQQVVLEHLQAFSRRWLHLLLTINITYFAVKKFVHTLQENSHKS
jgi:hypothetical protein